ncbi:MAG: Smr/MutS family protein [Bacteroidota bacterium]
MTYPQNIEHKLEFDQIKELLNQKCLSEMGQEYISKIRFVNRFDILEKMLLQVKEFKKILTSDTPFPSEHFFNIQPYIRKASIEGYFLMEDEFHQIKLLLLTFGNICKYFEQRVGIYPQTEGLFKGITFNKQLINSITKILDDEGKMRPNASPELAKISSKIVEKEKEVRSKINKIFTKAADNGWLADSGITIRDGRLVLPILAEFKRNVVGLVHDESATGQTVFIEPTEVFELNNFIRELQIAFRREREKILLELTNTIRPELPEIEKYTQRMGLVDFIRAKGLLSIELDADMPILNKFAQTKLVDAYHPLLKLSHQKAGLKVVPLNFELNREKRIVVISGPNAGGKSVCLKTVGILQYMLQCGLLIPAKSHSECGIYNDMMVDIGDEQSIENDLSTYSSHLLHMKYFTEFADAKTLFLIDEFGTGTDPQFGGPLAEAILNRLNQKNAFGVVTTHYSNLKNFASQTKGLENACMLFDHTKMQPTYILELGKPGSSYAFEIATKTGLNNQIIEYAKSKVGDKQRKLDDILIELEKEKGQAIELKKRYEENNLKSKNLIDDYSKLKTELDTKKNQLLKDARMEALAIITEANSQIENTIREIRENKADTETMRSVRKDIKEKTEELKTQVSEILPISTVTSSLSFRAESRNEKQTIAIGNNVKVDGFDSIGEVVELKKNKVLVAFGNMSNWIDAKKVVTISVPKKELKKSFVQGIDVNDKLQNFQHELNIIGMRGDEAQQKLQQYIDDAFLLGFKQVKIIHGRGYGILRKLVREQLKGNRVIENFHDEDFERGGDAITIVTLKV